MADPTKPRAVTNKLSTPDNGSGKKSDNSPIAKRVKSLYGVMQSIEVPLLLPWRINVSAERSNRFLIRWTCLDSSLALMLALRFAVNLQNRSS